MRFLLLPSGNALSHVAKGLAVRETLQARGHEVHIATSTARAPFLAFLGVPYHLVPDLQEADDGPAPTYLWFRDPRRFVRVVEAERRLMTDLRPDRVLGIFRFTTSTAAALAEIPCDTLACGCMIPAFQGVLGFEEQDAEAEVQRAFLNTFYTQTAARTSQALLALGRPPILDIRCLLLGHRTYLWDTPTFQPIAPFPGIEHVGPLPFEGWPSDLDEASKLESLGQPLAILSMGTALPPGSAPQRILDSLLRLGFHVALAGGGHSQDVLNHPRVTAFRFAPMKPLLKQASILVCQGGQQTLFEAMAQGVPVAVLPFHPEQAQNGRCLERLHQGRCLVPPTAFWGSSQVYLDALERLGDRDLEDRLGRLAGSMAPLAPELPFSASIHLAERLEGRCTLS